MKLREVDSSMVHAVGHNAKAKSLEVVFNSGRTWIYEDVPKKVYQELMKARSMGRYMNENVIDCYEAYPLGRR